MLRLLQNPHAIQQQPQRKVPYAPNELTGDLVIKALGGYIPNRLHMGVDIEFYKPIDPFCGRFLTEDCVEEVFPHWHVYDALITIYPLTWAATAASVVIAYLIISKKVNDASGSIF